MFYYHTIDPGRALARVSASGTRKRIIVKRRVQVYPAIAFTMVQSAKIRDVRGKRISTRAMNRDRSSNVTDSMTKNGCLTSFNFDLNFVYSANCLILF